MKKSFAFCMLLAAGLLAACGKASETSSNPAPASTTPVSTVPSSQPEEVKTVYQLTATYDELYDMYAAYEFYGLLSSDKNAVIYSATVLSMTENKNIPQVDEGTSFKYKVTTDDGIDTLEANIGGKKYTGYKNADGNFVLESYDFEFAGGYHRQVDLIVSETIEYADVEAWKAALTEKYKDRKPAVKVSDTFKGPVLYADGEHEGEPFEISFGPNGSFAAEAKIELNSDFTLKAVYGVGGYGGATYEGTWTVDTNTMLHVLTIGEDEITGVKDGQHEKFTWNFVHQAKDQSGAPVGDPINLTSTLSWVDPSAEAQA